MREICREGKQSVEVAFLTLAAFKVVDLKQQNPLDRPAEKESAKSTPFLFFLKIQRSFLKSVSKIGTGGNYCLCYDCSINHQGPSVSVGPGDIVVAKISLVL